MTSYKARYQSLDAWRGVACLAVLIYHSAFYASAQASLQHGSWLLKAIHQGWIGVPLFFVISGYCIAASAVRAPEGWEFVRRRFQRIYPAYWLALVFKTALLAAAAAWHPRLGTSAPHALSTASQLDAWQWLGNLTLTEAWRAHLVGPRTLYLLGVAWTLCYEEQFYALAAGILMWGRRWLLPGFAGITAITLVAQICAKALRWDTSGFFFDGYWHLFALGVLVYTWRTAATTLWRRLSLFGLILLPLAAFTCAGPVQLLRPSLVIGTAFAWTLCAFSRWDEELSSWQLSRGLAWCGVRCYSIYLLHWPIVRLLGEVLWSAGLRSELTTLGITLPLGVMMSLLISAWFYHLVERRFLSSRK